MMEPNVFLSVSDVHRLINLAEQRRASLQGFKGTKRSQNQLTKLIEKLYAVWK